ncbi:MAG TPA: hypothetical protein ENN63_01350 [Bacteroidetes bacterium]|nr:hypothetical protein [Bacteroidota bacterium]
MTRTRIIGACFLILFGNVLFSCRQDEPSEEMKKIQELKDMAIELQQVLSAEYLDTLYREYERMKERVGVLEEGIYAGPDVQDYYRTKESYRMVFQMMDSCIHSCTGLQKEISFLLSELEMLEQKVQNDILSSEEFQSKYRKEAELLRGISSRIHRAYRISYEQLETYRELESEIKKYMPFFMKVTATDPDNE